MLSRLWLDKNRTLTEVLIQFFFITHQSPLTAERVKLFIYIIFFIATKFDLTSPSHILSSLAQL